MLLLEVANLGDRVCLALSSPRIELRKGAVSSEGRGVHTRLLGFDWALLRKVREQIDLRGYFDVLRQINVMPQASLEDLRQQARSLVGIRQPVEL